MTHETGSSELSTSVPGDLGRGPGTDIGSRYGAPRDRRPEGRAHASPRSGRPGSVAGSVLPRASPPLCDPYRPSGARGSRPMKAARRSQSSAPGGDGTSAAKGTPGPTMFRYWGLIMARAPWSAGRAMERSNMSIDAGGVRIQLELRGATDGRSDQYETCHELGSHKRCIERQPATHGAAHQPCWFVRDGGKEGEQVVDVRERSG